jgi:hypothetical protein
MGQPGELLLSKADLSCGGKGVVLRLLRDGTIGERRMKEAPARSASTEQYGGEKTHGDPRNLLSHDLAWARGVSAGGSAIANGTTILDGAD